MSTAAVREILERIDQLPEADRLLLEQELTERREADWLREAAMARDLAKKRGIDQDTIDRAVEAVRYGNPRIGG